jgi:predicted transposase/invertase (TIGR01784 family)
MSKRVLISFDYALKRLLRDKANYDVLEGFLSELFGYDVKVKNIIESESNKKDDKDKHNRVDILIEDEKGELLAVELQFNGETDYFHRMMYGTSKILAERIEKGQHYDVLPKVISINIVYFELGQGEDYVYYGSTVFTGKHRGDKLKLNTEQNAKYGTDTPTDIYPEYYILKVKQFDDKAQDKLDEWIYFFKHNSVKDEFTAKGLSKVSEILVYENLTPEEKKEYDEMVDIREQNENNLSSAEYKGKIEGKEEARQEYEPIIAEKDAALVEKETALVEKEAALAEKEAALAEKDAALLREREEKEAAKTALARALAELEALKKNNQSNQ